MSVNAGDVLRIETFTPGGGLLEVDNGLDPSIELIDPNGNVISHTNVTGNELLIHAAQFTGQYRVRVFGDNSEGEYFLQVEGATGGSLLPSVTGSNPTLGGFVAQFPQTLSLTFSEELAPASIAASDLIVGGLPATSVAKIDDRTYLFTLDLAANHGDGTYQVQLPAGSYGRSSGGGQPAADDDISGGHNGPCGLKHTMERAALASLANVLRGAAHVRGHV